MALHLITGYAGTEHITSSDQGAYNIATFGGGNFVLNRGSKFAQTVLSNNSISIADGEAMLQGRYIKMSAGTSEELAIENGTQGTNRNDLICIRYQKSTVDGKESASLVVIKGTESTGTATDPTYNTGSITDGDDNIADFPLYRVKLDGINIQTVDTLFSVKISMSEYMDNYQLPVASNTQLGGVKIGSGINKASDGTISVIKTTVVENGETALITSGGVYTALNNGSVTKLGNSTYGSSRNPIYWFEGKPRVSDGYVTNTYEYDKEYGTSIPALGYKEFEIKWSDLGPGNIDGYYVHSATPIFCSLSNLSGVMPVTPAYVVGPTTFKVMVINNSNNAMAMGYIRIVVKIWRN